MAQRTPKRSPKSKASTSTGNKPEADIQREILQWLATTGLLYWRQNSGSMPVVQGGRVIRMVKLGEVGLPDIVACVNGRMVGLEVKSAVGKLRDEQKIMSLRFSNAGAHYFVVRSVIDAAAAIGEMMEKFPTLN